MIYLYSYLHSGNLDGLDLRFIESPGQSQEWQETPQTEPGKYAEQGPWGEVDRQPQQRAKCRYHGRQRIGDRVADRVADRYRLRRDRGVIDVDRRHGDARLQLGQPAARLVEAERSVAAAQE